MSTFAAMICSAAAGPAAARETVLRRSSRTWMIDVDPDAATPTQSPTAGKSAAEDDSWRKRPLTSAQPRAPPSMRYSPRCSSTTRAQARPARTSSRSYC